MSTCQKRSGSWFSEAESCAGVHSKSGIPVSRGVLGLSLGDKVTVLWYGTQCSIWKMNVDIPECGKLCFLLLLNMPLEISENFAIMVTMTLRVDKSNKHNDDSSKLTYLLWYTYTLCKSNHIFQDHVSCVVKNWCKIL